jgi:hypothetical protein
MKIAILPARIDAGTSLTALALAAGLGDARLVTRAAEPRCLLSWTAAPWTFPVEILDRGVSFLEALEMIAADGSRNLVFDPGALTSGAIADLQDRADVMAITVRPCPSEEIAALSLWQDLEGRRLGRSGAAAVPVLLPIDRIPEADAGSAWRAATMLRDDWTVRLGRTPRLLPPALPVLPQAVRERIYAARPGTLDPLVVQAGRRMAAGLRVLRQDPQTVWSRLARAWQAIVLAMPLPRLEGSRFARLARVRDAYGLGDGPAPRELAAAPRLDDWALARRAVPILRGRLGAARTDTAPVVAMDGDRGWVRTTTCLYRLGRPEAA